MAFDLWALPARSLPPAERLACVSGQVCPPLLPDRHPLLNQLSLPVSKPEFREKPKGTEPFTNCLQTVSKGVVAVHCK